jgi:hypothetical protein
MKYPTLSDYGRHDVPVNRPPADAVDIVTAAYGPGLSGRDILSTAAASHAVWYDRRTMGDRRTGERVKVGRREADRSAMLCDAIRRLGLGDML